MSSLIGDIKDTLNGAVQTLFGHTPASPSRPTNDAAPHKHTRTPTESHRTSPATVDLTGSPPQRAPEQPQARPPNKTRVSDDQQRLIKGYYGNPSDGTPIPDPANWLDSSGTAKMGKPGAASSFKPRDTINRNTNAGLGGSPTATYGRPSTSKKLYFLGDLPDNLHDLSSVKGYDEPTADREPALKKRRLDTLQRTTPVKGHGAHHDRTAMSSGSAMGTRHTPSTQPRPTSSRHSNASERKSPSLPGLSSEFNLAEQISNPNRKAPRNRLAAHPSPSGTQHNGRMNGDMAEVILVDDEPTSKFSGFKQGVHDVPSIDMDELSQPVTTSRHFANGKAKMSHSTRPPRGELAKLQHRNDRTSSELHQFRRTDPEEEISADELGHPTPAKRSRSPAKRAKKTTTAHERKTASSTRSERWPLTFARSDQFESNAPELYITGTGTNSFRIATPTADGTEAAFDFSLSQVVHAWSDDHSRIRLVGPRQAHGGTFHVDLQFPQWAHFLLFQAGVARSITKNKVIHKEESIMETIFRKLLPGGRITKSPPPLRPQIEENSSPATRPPGVIDRLLARHAQPTANNVRVRKTGVRTTDRPARSTRTNPPTYQVEAEAEDSSNPERYSLVHGLGAPWKHQLTYGSGRRRATVDFLDLERLDEGEFLNDQLIDFYMLYLFNLKPQLANKVYIFNTHFFSTLTRKVPGQKSAINYSAVARWTAKEDLFGYDYIVVPINQDVHWFVAIICNVSNISRKLAVEDSIDQAAYDETVDNMPASEQGPGQAKATDTAVRTTSPLLMSDSYPPPLVEEQDDEMLLNSEESKFDLIDTQATEPSPAAETTRMEQLTLGDPAPIGILPNAGSSPDSKKTRRKPPVKKWDSDQPTIIILDSLASGARSPAVRALKNYLFEEGREKRGIEAKIPQNAFYAKPSQIPTQENYYDCGIYLLAYMQQFFENPDEFKDRLLGGEMRTGDWPEMEIPNMRDRMRDILQQLHKKQEEERKLSGKEKKAKSSEPVPKTTDVATKAPMPAAKKEDAAVPAAAPLATKTATEPSPPKSTPDICDEKPPVADSFRRLSSPFKYKPAPVIKQTNGRNSSPIRETTIMKVDNTPSPPGYAEKDQHAQQQSWLDRQDEVSASSNPPTRRKSPVVLIPSPEKRRLVNEQTKSSPSTVKARSPKKQRVVSPPKAGVAEMASKKASTSAKLESPVRVRSPASDSRGSSQNPISLDDSQEPAVVASFTPKTPKAQFVQTSSATVKNGNSSRKQHHRPEHLLDGAMDGKDSHVLETIEVSRAKVYDDLPEIVSPSIIMKRAVQQPYEKPYDRAEDSAVPETPPAETRSPAAAGASLSQPISL